MSKDIDPFRERLRLLRKRWSEAVLQILGAKKGGILNAMLLGDKQQMDAEIKEQYQVNGIAHILAISGVCFLCWFFYSRRNGLKWGSVGI